MCLDDREVLLESAVEVEELSRDTVSIETAQDSARAQRGHPTRSSRRRRQHTRTGQQIRKQRVAETFCATHQRPKCDMASVKAMM